MHRIIAVFRAHGFRGTVRRAWHRISQIILAAFLYPFVNLPSARRRNRICILIPKEYCHGSNARVLFNELIRRGYNKKYRVSCLTADVSYYDRDNFENVDFYLFDGKDGAASPKALKAIAESEYLFYCKNYYYPPKLRRKNQVRVNLWHGNGYKASKPLPRNLNQPFDYALVTGPLFVESKAKFWNCPAEKILCCGYPRYDFMKHPVDKAELAELLPEFRDEGKKLIMWLPTFRDVPGSYVFYSSLGGKDLLNDPKALDLDVLDQYCEKNRVVMLIKAHPGVEDLSLALGARSNIRKITDQQLKERGIELNSLMAYADALITDYSSAAVDFLLLNRPLGFVLSDFEEYKKNRGFIFEDPLAYMPGEKIRSFSDLLFFVTAVADGKDDWREAREKLLPLMHTNTENCTEALLQAIGMDKEYNSL